MLPRFFMVLALSLIAVLTVSCAALKSGHDKGDLKSREAILRDNLFQMRKMIDQYSADQGKLPQSLDDLVAGGYLRRIPEDPITKKPDWKLIMGEDPNSKGKVAIIDIRSASSEKSTEGKPYNEW
jgi:general secretion pathway protein G